MNKDVVISGLWGVLFLASFPLFAELIHFELDHDAVQIQTGNTNWEIASQRNDGAKGVTEYVFDGESIQGWTERVTINYFKGLQGAEVIARLLDFTKKGLESQCAEVTWETISKTEYSALYQWTAKACVGVPDQSEIARAILGKNALYILHYANKKVPMPVDQFQAWMKNLEEAVIRE